jgi:asparagine synthase (glutamine-hydrolysing)
VSGIVGVVNLDGSPVDRELLDRMTGFLAFRGPDAQATWVEGPVGFGHTLLRTTFASEHERQPCSLDGKVWITADARIDDRANLIEKLAGHGRRTTPAVPDGELILHAYHVWGEKCVEHLLGDFAFAIWDTRERQLFCARDHFGIKPFYYARVTDGLLFSNTLDCLRLHPAVSDELNDLAVADFLIFGGNQDQAATTFADIRRLPPAHCLTCSGGEPRLIRYWTLSAGAEIRCRGEEEYVEHLRELLRVVVGDRLGPGPVSVSMTGGLDSTAVAATAREVLAQRGRPADLKAFTSVCDRALPDQERYYSGLAAEALGIPIRYQQSEDYEVFARWDEPRLRTPEPSDVALLPLYADRAQWMAEHGRVALTGWDGDALLSERLHHYFRALIKHRRYGRLAADLWRFVWYEGALPRLGARTRLKRWLGMAPPPEQGRAFPPWLRPDLVERLRLRARWEELSVLPLDHPSRPYAFCVLNARNWPALFEDFDPGVTGLPLEVRHPLFDLRLVHYLLSIPPVPWCVNKRLLRAAMRGILPDRVCRRPKSPLAGDLIRELVIRDRPQRVDSFHPAPDFTRIVDQAALPKVAGETVPEDIGAATFPFSLNCWLTTLTQRHPKGGRDARQPADEPTAGRGPAQAALPGAAVACVREYSRDYAGTRPQQKP